MYCKRRPSAKGEPVQFPPKPATDELAVYVESMVLTRGEPSPAGPGEWRFIAWNGAANAGRFPTIVSCGVFVELAFLPGHDADVEIAFFLSHAVFMDGETWELKRETVPAPAVDENWAVPRTEVVTLELDLSVDEPIDLLVWCQVDGRKAARRPIVIRRRA